TMEESEQPLQQQTGVLNGRVKEEEKAEEEEEGYDCDECGIAFPDERSFVVHMRGHGYELANSTEANQSYASEEVAGPSAAKRPKLEEGTSNGRPKYPALPGNEDEDDYHTCPGCSEVCLTVSEYSAHLRVCPVRANHALFACSVCKTRKLDTEEKLEEHEAECRHQQAMELREKSLTAVMHCIFCGKRQNNAFVLGSHIASEHSDIIKWLRFHHMMAPELLPFRCSSCNVGFEDTRLLLDHFRLKEEYGKSCEGSLIVHDYQLSLKTFESLRKELPVVKIPKIPKLDDMDYDIYADIFQNEYCPCESPPPLRKDSTLTRQCDQCSEVWPIVQMKWHIKMEHPKFYFDNAKFKCKQCKQFGSYCPKLYEMHYEKCQHDKYEPLNNKLLSISLCNFNADKPSMHKGKNDRPLKSFPENIGNEMRPCRFCKESFSPEGLLLHQKNDHPLEHFTDAPYLCGRCDDVGFYSHQEYKHHATRCTGETPVHLHKNVYAITSKEVEIRTGKKRIEVPSYRAIVGEDRRKHGTYTSFNRTHNCPLCENWCTSLTVMGEHFKDAHGKRAETCQPFLCGGCGIVFGDAADLKKHLRHQELLGNVQCFDMGTTHTTARNNFNMQGPHPVIINMDPNRYVKAPPLVAPRAFGSQLS
ncbi:hypothetical protein PFISCL1PPCAC_26597, partial [Pristionchus fissidentatus]